MNKQVLEYSPITGYRFIPNIQTRIQHESGGYLIKTNSSGFRSEFDFQREKNNLKRVLLFGDSYTAGDGVSNKMRYSDVLMKLLPGVEIYNFGMPGTGTDQQYLIYREFAKSIEHDLVMIVALVENIRRVNSRYRYYLNDMNEKIIYEKPFFEFEGNEIVLKNTPVKPAHINIENLPLAERKKVDEGGRFPEIRKLINKSGLKETVQKLTRYQPLPEYKDNSEQWKLMKSILLKWISELNKPALLVPLPLHQYIEEESDFTHIEKRFEEFSGVDNVRLFNPIWHLRNFSVEDRRKFRFKYDAHPTAFGHDALAKIFRPEIESLLFD